MTDDGDPEDPGIGEPTESGLEETPRYLWRVLRTAVDYLALNTETGREVARRAQPYPDPFVFSHLPSHAGAELGGWVGMREGEAPLILFVPGTFQTKDAANTRGKVLRLFERTTAHISVVDLRGFGHSSDLKSTGGYLEALDVARIAEHFGGNDRVSEVVLAGESLGAATALIAGARAPDAVDGVLATNPFADLEWMIRWLSTHPPTWDPGHIVHHAFETFLRHVTGDSEARYEPYIARRADELGIEVAELSRLASPRFHVGRLRCPTLILHAVDDPIIAPFHAHVLDVAASGNDHVQVHTTKLGGHATFDLVDHDWYWETVLNFLDEVSS